MISSQAAAPVKSPIFGPAYISQSSNLIDEQCINIYPELVEVGTGREIGALYGAPGLVSQYSVGAGPIRNMIVMSGILYVVSGSDLWSIDTTGATTQLSAGGIGGTGGYLYSTSGGFSTITLPFVASGNLDFVTSIHVNGKLAIFVGISVTQQDTFGLINEPGTFNFFQSAIDNVASWPALNFGEASGDPGAIVFLIQTRREIFVLKTTKTEVWNNAGTSGFVFQREQGPYIEAGCVAPASVAKSGETIFWLAQNDQGEGIVVKLVGYGLQRISTHFIEREIQSWPDMSDAIGYAYQQRGHTFYVLSSKSGNQTWVYDDTVSTFAQKPFWHRRGLYTPLGLDRHPGNCYVSFNGMSLVGSNANGNIYSYDLGTFTDAGTTRTWLRSWRALPQFSGRIMKFGALTLGMETGVSVPAGYAPNVMLRWSDDGGHIWAPMRTAAIGAVGETSFRVKFNRLGALKAESGYDRLFELSSSDPISPSIIDALLETAP